MQTQTSTVTKTKLTIATGIALIGAGGAALAGLPWLQSNVSDVNQSEVQTKLLQFCGDNICETTVNDCFASGDCGTQVSDCLYYWTKDQCSQWAGQPEEFSCQFGVVQSCLEYVVVKGPVNFNLKNPDFSVAAPACTDSDGGMDAKVKGTTTDTAITKEDSCYNESGVTEWFCNADGEAARDFVMCEYGSECSDGVCIPIPQPAYVPTSTIKTASSTVVYTPTKECVDTDGFDLYAKGSVSGYFDTSYQYYSEQQDVCGEKDQWGFGTQYNNGIDYGPGVAEKVCLADKTVKTEYTLCPNGCFDGACK